ncbi:phage tail tape measure protein [Pseudomonas monteilii]|uniref:phage tail tape measure protein n=1 Tax=Pseudomonas monteilii TaxID=76759 RepID=UPI0018A612E0|nr:phage tail tape measure protein [Pseudomonas monteilii]BBV96474.1 hypothetical protein STW0522PSE72_18250 [Pseudomonas monteilii]
MNQTSRLSIEIDSRNAEQKASDVKKALNALEDAGLSIKPAMDRAGDAMGKAGESAKGSSLNVAAMERQVKSLSGVLIGLAGPLAAAFSVQKIAAAAQQYADLTNRLRLVTDGTAQLAQAQNDVFRVAQASRQSLESTSTIYQRIAQNGRALGLSFADVARVTETVAKSVAMSGASAASADAALVQFGQALASGVLRGEELNSILEQTPALAQTIARGLGVTVGQLRAMGAEGQLTSDKVIKAIENQKDAVDKLAASMQVTVSQAMTAFTNSLTTTIGKLDEATGASSKLAAGILGISEAMDRYRSGEFMDFFTADKKTVEGFNNEISTSLARLRDLDQVRSKLNKSDPSDTVFFNFKFYNKQELDAEIAGLNSNIGKAQAAIKILQKSSADLSAQAPKGEAAAAGLSAAAKSYTDSQQKALAKLQDNGDAIKEANRYIAEHTELTEADKAAILSNAYAAEAQKKANKGVAAATREANKAYQENAGQKMLDDARQRYAVLLQQKSAIDDQGKGARTLGVEAKKLIELETEIAQLKEKKTLTAAQKQVLAMADLNLAQQKQNAALEQANKLDQQRLENAAKLLSFQDQLNDSLETEQHGLDAQIAGLGSGKKLQERIREDLKIRQDYQKQLAKLQRDYQRIVNPTAEQTDLYEKETRALKSALDKRLSMQEDYYRKLDIAQSDWSVGANDAWYDYLDEASDISSQTYDLFSNTFHGIEDAIADAATSGKLSFKDLADSIIADLARMATRAYVTIPLLSALGLGGSTPGGGGSILGGGGDGGGFSFGNLLRYAQTGYSVLTGVGPAALAGYQSGGIMGGLQGVGSYYGNLASSAWGKISGWFGGGAASNLAGGAGSNVGYGLGQNLVGGSAGSASYAAGSAGGGWLSGLSSAALPAAAAFAALKAYEAYRNGTRLDPKDTRGNALAWATGFQPIAELNGAVSKLTEKLGIGGVLGNLLNIPSTLTAMVGSALFGGSWQTKDVGLSLAVEDGDFAGRQYEYQKKKGGLFGKNKKRTRYSALDPEMQAALDATYDATEGSVLDLFDRLNVELNDGVLDGLNIGEQKISTKDKTAEEIQAEITKWFGGVADSMVSAVDAATAAGLGGYNFEGLTAFVQNLEGVNDVIRYLNKDMFETSVAGGKLAEQLTAIAGGLDVLKANGATYYGAFIGESERMDDTLDAVTRAFVAANQTLPETRTGFRDMVESINTTTQAGMQMFSTLMALSGQASTYYDILEQRASNGVNAAFAALQRSIAAQQKAINKSLTDANSRISDLTAISSALGSALKQLRGTGDDAVRMLRSQAQATLQSALAIAKAGGSLSGFAGLTDALDVLGSNNTDLYGSLEEFNRDQGRTANAVAELNKLNGKQLSAAEKSALAMQAQLDALDAQLEFAQAQVDALNGIDNSVKSVADAVKEMNAAVVAAIASISGKSTPQNAGVLIDSIYKDQLGRDADAEGKQYWVDQLASGALNNQNIVGAITNAAAIEAAYKAAGIAMNEGASYWAGQLNSGALTAAQLQEAVRNAAIANGSIPAFASGGMHSGGIRLVGERGPELEVTGPARIYNASQTAAMLKGGDGWKEVVAAIQVLQQYAYQTTKNTGNTAQELRQQNEAGVLIQGATA